MLAKQYGHMKIVGLIAPTPPSLPKSLYRSPGTCVCSLASAGRCLLHGLVGGTAQLRMGGQVGGGQLRPGALAHSLTLLVAFVATQMFSYVSSSSVSCRLELLREGKETDVCPPMQFSPDWILSLLGVYNSFIY